MLPHHLKICRLWIIIIIIKIIPNGTNKNAKGTGSDTLVTLVYLGLGCQLQKMRRGGGMRQDIKNMFF